MDFNHRHLSPALGAQCAFPFCKLLILKDWSGRMDLNHRLPGPEPGISNNVGPVKHFLSALLSFHLKEFFSFVFFLVCSSLRRRPRLACNLSVGFSPT